MPLRPELPPGLGLPRRGEGLMRLPRLHFPMVGGAPLPVEPVETADVMPEPRKEEESPVEMMRPAPAPGTPLLAARDCTRVIVFGRSGCPACREAIQDLIDRQVCFTYHDVTRDEKAMAQLTAICGDAAMVPVIIQMGVR